MKRTKKKVKTSVYYGGTTEWARMDTYSALITGKSFFTRFWVAFGVILKNKIKIEWEVPATKKDKRLNLIGKKLK